MFPNEVNLKLVPEDLIEGPLAEARLETYCELPHIQVQQA